MKADAFLTRAGVFTYRTPEGKEVRELRPEAEVFSADSLASLELVPVTDNHPRERVDATNVKAVAVGHIGDNVRRDGNKVKARVLITDAETIARVKAGKRETSCGYVCDVENEPGTHNGEHYDSIQRNIRYNHVAIVDRGRAGPEVRLHLDAADGDGPRVQLAKTEHVSSEGEKTMKVRIDEIEYEAPDALGQAVAKLAKRADEHKAEADKAQAKADGIADELKTAKEALVKATSPEAVRTAVTARLALERAAAKVLGDGDHKLDAKADEDVMRAAIIKASPSAKLDAASAEYLRARFDHVVETVGERSVADVQRAATATNRGDSVVSADDARKRMIERGGKMWTSKLAATSEGA